MKAWFRRNWYLLALLIGGAFLTGISIGFFLLLYEFLVWFYPILQMLAVIIAVSFVIAMLTAPRKTLKAIKKLVEEMRK